MDRLDPHRTTLGVVIRAVLILGVLAILIFVLVRDSGLQMWLTLAIFALFLLGLLPGLLGLLVSTHVFLWLLTVVSGQDIFKRLASVPFVARLITAPMNSIPYELVLRLR